MAIFDFISKYITKPARSMVQRYVSQPTRSIANFLGGHHAQNLGHSAINALRATNLINDAQVKTGRDVLKDLKMGSDKVNNLLDKI